MGKVEENRISEVTHNTLHRRKILIVEDNLINREILSEILCDEFDIITASDGDEGYRLLAENFRSLSLVMLDVYMPVCTGFEFLERVKGDALLENVPVIVTTGSNKAEDEVRCLDLGAADFVTKPYNPRVVLGRIHSILKLKESVATLSAVEYDEVTGVYTMPAFFHHATSFIKSGEYSSFDLYSSDIMEFKLINSVYGEKIGDDVLRFQAGMYAKYLKDGLVARQGDKFYCLLPSQKSINYEDFAKISKEASSKSPVTNLNIKYGIYKNVDITQPISILCDRVVMAINTIKRDVRKNLVFYDDKVSNKRLLNQKMEADFERAILNEEFKVWYQPKIDIITEKIVAAEALVRWIGADGKIIPPGEFIPLFEQDGLIHKLDEYVFLKVCQFQRERIKNEKMVVPISVNLSRSSVYHEETISNYMSMVMRTGIAKKLVPLELTESATSENKRIINLAEDLVGAGFSLHMDDFGAGYSSLSSLGNIPFDVMKIDKSLINQIGTKRGDVVLQYTILIAQQLGMKVVAEGVEDKEQVEFLKRAGCDMIQGYYYSAPRNEEVFTQMLDNNSVEI